MEENKSERRRRPLYEVPELRLTPTAGLRAQEMLASGIDRLGIGGGWGVGDAPWSGGADGFGGYDGGGWNPEAYGGLDGFVGAAGGWSAPVPGMDGGGIDGFGIDGGGWSAPAPEMDGGGDGGW